MCETRDVGIKWPHRHTLMFDGDRSIDMRHVCPKDVKKNASAAGLNSLLEEVGSRAQRQTKVGVKSIEMLPENWFWMQKKHFDIGWSDESKCQASHKEEGKEMHRLYHCLEWHEVRRGIPDG